MAGKDGLVERLFGRLSRVTDVLETEFEAFAANPVEHAARGDKVAKTARSFSLAVRATAEAGLAVHRLAAAAEDDGDHEDGEADDDEPRLSPEALEALRDDVERRYARFDQEPVGALGADPGDVRAGPAGGGRGLGEPGTRPAAAPAGRLVDLAVPGRTWRGQDAGGRAVAHGPSG